MPWDSEDDENTNTNTDDDDEFAIGSGSGSGESIERLISGESGRVALRNLASGEVESSLPGCETAFTAVEPLSAEWMLASASDFSVQALNVRTKRRQTRLAAGHHRALISHIEHLSKTRVVSASAGADGRVCVWNARDGTRVQSFEHSGLVSLQVIDEERVATGSTDGNVKVWRPSGECVATLGHSPRKEPTKQQQFFKKVKLVESKPVFALASLADQRLASGSGDSTIKIWSLAGDFQCLSLLVGHTGEVLSLAAVSDHVLASGSADKSIKLWDVAGKQCVQTLDGHSSQVLALTAISESRLASAALDKTIKLWNIATTTTTDDSTCLHTVYDLSIKRLKDEFSPNILKLLK